MKQKLKNIDWKNKYIELKQDIQVILTQIMCECDLTETDGLDTVVENYLKQLRSKI